MGYASVLATFKIEHEDCLSVKDDDDSKAQKIDNKDNDRKSFIGLPFSSDASQTPINHVVL